MALALPAAARPLTEAEGKGLTKAVTRYQQATERGNASAIVATIPPRIINAFVGAAGIEASKVNEVLVAQTKEILKSAKISDFTVGAGPYDATDVTLADGTPLVWVVVPAQFVTEANGQKVRNDQPLFAVEEDGAWYFSRVDGAQAQQLIATAYPFVAGVTFPAPAQTPVP